MTMTHGHLNSATKNAAANTPAGRTGRFWTAAIEPVARHLATWSYRRRSRQHLQAMDDHMLSDIGLSRDEAFDEGQKPFWRA